MNEYTKKKFLILVALIILVFCVWLVIFGQSQTGTWSGLGTEILGLCGILALLYIYNKPYSK